LRKIARVVLKNLLQQRNALFDWHAWEPDHAWMVSVPVDDQLSEVFVESDENSTFAVRSSQDLFVAKPRRTVGREIHHIVSVFAQPVAQAAASAGVDQELHFPATAIASRLSPAITAWA
jgi:hypothetical protein